MDPRRNSIRWFRRPWRQKRGACFVFSHHMLGGNGSEAAGAQPSPDSMNGADAMRTLHGLRPPTSWLDAGHQLMVNARVSAWFPRPRPSVCQGKRRRHRVSEVLQPSSLRHADPGLTAMVSAKRRQHLPELRPPSRDGVAANVRVECVRAVAGRTTPLDATPPSSRATSIPRFRATSIAGLRTPTHSHDVAGSFPTALVVAATRRPRQHFAHPGGHDLAGCITDVVDRPDDGTRRCRARCCMSRMAPRVEDVAGVIQRPGRWQTLPPQDRERANVSSKACGSRVNLERRMAPTAVPERRFEIPLDTLSAWPGAIVGLSAVLWLAVAWTRQRQVTRGPLSLRRLPPAIACNGWLLWHRSTAHTIVDDPLKL